MDIPNLIKDNRRNNFTLIDNEVIIDQNLTPHDFRVYCYLLYRSMQKGSCFPSYSTACKDLNISRQGFSNCIKKLNDLGYITTMNTKTNNGTYGNIIK